MPKNVGYKKTVKHKMKKAGKRGSDGQKLMNNVLSSRGPNKGMNRKRKVRHKMSK